MKFLNKLKKGATELLEKHGDSLRGSAGASSSSAHKEEADATRAEVEQALDDGSNIPLSTCDGNKKSLFIGINYFGTQSELRGCINDVKNIKKFVVEQWKFPTDPEHMKTLTDDDPNNMPTRENILKGFKWLVEGAKSGDSLFLHYSGHGASQKDTDGNSEEADGNDETLVPLDYEKAGIIVDDDVHAALVAVLPQGVRLTAIMDCCHSGSIFDLPYTYTTDGNLSVHEVDNRKLLMDAAIKAGMSWMKGDKKAAQNSGIEVLKLGWKIYTTPEGGQAKGDGGAPDQDHVKIRSSVADVIQFSGCRDEQTSADANIGGEATGAMSWSLIKAFETNGHNQTYLELLKNVRTLLHGKYTQVPQMSTGHRMDMNSTFKM